MIAGGPLSHAFSVQKAEVTLSGLVRKSPLLGRVLTLLVVCHLIFHFFWWLPFIANFTDVGGDTTIYFAAASGVHNHLQPYSVGFHYTPSRPPITYVYWPQLAILLSPLSSLGHPVFARIWRYILTISFWVFAWSLATIAQGRATPWGVCVAGTVIACVPDTYVVMWNGNADPIIWALVGTAFATRRTCEWLAVAAQIKTYVLAGIGLLLVDEPRLLRRVVPIVCAGFILSWMYCPGWLHPWTLAVAPIAHHGSFFNSNISLPMAILRLIRMCGWRYDGGLLPGWAQLVLICSSLIMEIGAIAVATKIRKPYRYPALLVLSGLAQPLCWPSYLTSGLTLLALRMNELSRTDTPVCSHSNS